MKKIKTADFDKIFDGGKQDITQHLDIKTARRVNQQPRRVNVDFPNWMVSSLDREATRLGVTRQSLIKMWLSERLETRV